MKVAIMTDSNSGITQAQAKDLGVFVLPMPFTINKKEYLEDINLNQEEFYRLLMDGAEVFTSQPAVGDVTNKWDEILKDYDQIVHIPMSSGLSGSCQTALMLSGESEYADKVFVVDSQRISVTQKSDVLDAVELVKQGKTAQEIHDILMGNKLESSIYITVTTLEYLKKGGRVTPAAAALGGLLKLKPILGIFGEKLDKFDTSRTMQKAEKIMLNAIKNDMAEKYDSEGMGKNCRIMVAYTYDKETALKTVEMLKNEFPDHEIWCDPLSLSVACHIGPGSVAIAACKKIL